MRDSDPSVRYSSICNVLCVWTISLIPSYRSYRLYDTYVGKNHGFASFVDCNAQNMNLYLVLVIHGFLV